MTQYDEPFAKKVPFADLLTTIFNSLLNNRQAFQQAAWIPIVLLGAANAFGPIDPKPQDILTPAPVMILTMIAGIIFTMSFGVSWRRFLALREEPTFLCFGQPFWSYLGVFLLGLLGYCAIFAVCLIPAVILAIPILMNVPATATTSIIGGAEIKPDFARIAEAALLCIAAFIPAVWWWIRHIPIFTARALGDFELTWQQTSHGMSGQVFRYFATTFVLSLVFSMASGMIAWALTLHGAGPGAIAAKIVLGIFTQLCAFGTAAVIASADVLFYNATVATVRPITENLPPHLS